MQKRKKHALCELISREYGVKCPWWTSLQILRHMAFGPRRRWVKIFQSKETSLLEMSGDLMWVTRTGTSDRPNASHNAMIRILGDGRTMTVYKMELLPRAKEVEIYEIPHPVYRSALPQREYQPVMFLLRKSSILTRHHLETGEMYNRVVLGSSVSSLSINFVSDVLVGKSPRLHSPTPSTSSGEAFFFRFHLFQLHPFRPMACFDVHSNIFPGKEDRSRYGKLRNAEIHDGLLLIMTDKSYTLIYSAEAIIKAKCSTSEEAWINEEMGEGGRAFLVKEAPPRLFVTFTHADILGLGGCPWAYVAALSDELLEVRDLETDNVLVDGRVRWEEWEGQQITPDYLMFHPDDSSRLIHVRTNQIRVLAIRERNGKRCLEEQFRFPEKHMKKEKKPRYSMRGRKLVSLFMMDNAINNAVSFNVEPDLRLLVILEAERDMEHNCTHLLNLLFYDSISHQKLWKEKVDVRVDGDIETNRLSVSIDRDILNIVSHKGSVHTILSYRLKEVYEDEDEWRQDREERMRHARRKRKRDNGWLSELSDFETPPRNRRRRRAETDSSSGGDGEFSGVRPQRRRARRFRIKWRSDGRVPRLIFRRGRVFIEGEREEIEGRRDRTRAAQLEFWRDSHRQDRNKRGRRFRTISSSSDEFGESCSDFSSDEFDPYSNIA